MPKYKIVTLLNALPGQDDAFNEWFTSTHLPDTLRVPGIVSGQRFCLTEEQFDGASRDWKYLALYDVETNDLAEVIAELKRRIGTSAMVSTDTIAPGRFLHFFEPITDRMEQNK